MLFPVLLIRKFSKFIFILMTAFFAAFVSASDTPAKTFVQKSGTIGVIKGIVRDETGNPISDATVAIFRVGTSKLLKQVRSATDGSFLAKILRNLFDFSGRARI